MDSSLESVNQGEVAAIRSPIKSSAQLQQEYMPVIDLDNDAEDDLGGAMLDPATEPVDDAMTGLAAAPEEDAQRAEVVNELVDVVANIRSQLGATLDIAAVSGALETAIASVESMLGSEDQTRKSVAHGADTDLLPHVVTEEQTSQPIVERAADDMEQTGPVSPNVATDEQASQPVVEGAAHDMEQTVTGSMATEEEAPQPVVEGASDDMEQAVTGNVATEEEEASQPVLEDASDDMEQTATGPISSLPEQMSQSSIQDASETLVQMDATQSTLGSEVQNLGSGEQTSKPVVSDEQVVMEPVVCGEQMSEPVVSEEQVLGEEMSEPVVSDEQVSHPVLLDVRDGPAHCEPAAHLSASEVLGFDDFLAQKEADSQPLLPLTVQPDEASSDQPKGHVRRWFSCVSCSRRSMPVPKRKMEDETQEIEPEAKRSRRWTKAEQ